MSRTNDLAILLDDFQAAVDTVQDIARQIRSMFTNTAKQETEVAAEPIRFEDLRGLCAQKSREGHTAEIREIITGFGAKKLSEIEPNLYAEVQKKVEAIV